MVDFRLIPVKTRRPNKYDKEKTYVIPAIVKEIGVPEGPIVPIIIERLHFKTGKMIDSSGITFVKSLTYMEDETLPFETDAIVYKSKGKISFKVIAKYNTGIVEEIFNVPEIVCKNEEDILDIFHHNYRELNEWIDE